MSDNPEEPPDQNALLTESYRRHLMFGYDDVSDAAERMERMRIRERLAVSITADGPLLNEHVEFTDIFDGADPTAVAEGVRSFVSFLYKAADATTGVDAELTIRDGVAEGRGDRLSRIKTKLRTAPATVTMGEIQLLAEHGSLSNEEHTDLVKRFFADDLSTEDIEEIVEGRDPPAELQHTLLELAREETDDETADSA